MNPGIANRRQSKLGKISWIDRRDADQSCGLTQLKILGASGPAQE
jgi:hypothetical protein